MLDDVLKWTPQVDAVVKKWGRGRDREDLRQELWLAIVEVGPTSAETASRVCELRAAQLTGKQVTEEAAEVMAVQNPDKRIVAAAVSRLPELEQYVIRRLFYDDWAPELVAQELGRAVSWVVRTKKTALKRMEEMLTENK